MRIIQRYVTESFLAAFFLAGLVLTFVLSIGLLVKVTSLIAKGLPLAVIGKFFLTAIPETIGFTIPLAILVGALLVFGRLSADSEIASMRACGINLVSVMFWPLVFSLLMSGLCFYLQNEVTPKCQASRAQMLADSHAAEFGLDVMDPGRFNEGPGQMMIWFASRDGEWMNDVLIFDKTPKGLDRETRARRARVERQGLDLKFDLYDATIDPFSDDRPGAAQAARFSHVVEGAFKPANRVKRVRDFGFQELVTKLQEAEVLDNPGKDGSHIRAASARQMASELREELNKRLALSCAAFCFALIGMPLGIRAHRRESTIGVAMGLGIALVFYLAMIMGDACRSRPEFYPHLIVWLPVALCLVVAVVLIPRNQ
jgi:lipopolysaccharide export system permease protein